MYEREDVLRPTKIAQPVRPAIEELDPSRESAPMAGTPLYLAPEIWQGTGATERSDLYALGLVLYELLTGDVPHAGLDLAELVAARLLQNVPRVASIRADIPPVCSDAM